MVRSLSFSALILFCLTGFVGSVYADGSQTIILQSTTSTQNSGLLDYILPIFEKSSGIKVHVVSVGTGQALKNAANGDGDVLLVHAKSEEEKFVQEGFGVERFDVMFNDFVIIGPKTDPVKISPLKDVTKALQKIAKSNTPFVSRGDDSGTHKKELSLWSAIGPVPGQDQSWYRESGSGMGTTLNIAAGMNAYVMSDRATWIAFKNKSQLKILNEGDERLFNQYGVILVNPAKHKNVKAKQGQQFINWLLSEPGQMAIKSFTLEGKQLFFPNAKPRVVKKAS